MTVNQSPFDFEQELERLRIGAEQALAQHYRCMGALEMLLRLRQEGLLPPSANGHIPEPPKVQEKPQ